MPEYQTSSQELYEAVASLWPAARHLPNLSLDVSRTRYLSQPLDRLLQPWSLEERQSVYRRQALSLARKAAGDALRQAELSPQAIDLVIAVSCTGVLIPSLDVFLMAELGLRSDVVRLPVTEWGCSGGAAALARAYDWLRAYPRAHALVVAVELPSLTFQPGDQSRDNLISSLVFGDGAAAAVVGPDDGFALSIEDVAEMVLPDTAQALGFDLRDGGFHVVLDRRLPDLLASRLPDALAPILKRWELEVPDFAAIHAGGERILDCVGQAFGWPEELLASSRAVFHDYGNVSSASVLFTLARELPPNKPRGRGLVVGLGPGISLQLLALRR